MGEFFNPNPPAPHHCNFPRYHLTQGWRCDCGKAYVVENFGHDTNPGELSWGWKRAPQHDSPGDDGLK